MTRRDRGLAAPLALALAVLLERIRDRGLAAPLALALANRSPVS